MLCQAFGSICHVGRDMDAPTAETVTTNTIIDVAVPVAVFVMMFALGLGLTVACWLSLRTDPAAV